MKQGKDMMGDLAPDEILNDTIPGLLARKARLHPDAVAYRTLRSDGWRDVSFKDYAAKIARLGASMTAQGIKRGDRVCIIGDVSPDWMIADVATIRVSDVAFPERAAIASSVALPANIRQAPESSI